MQDIKESPLENWFRIHEPHCRYSLAGTIFTPPSFGELLRSYRIDTTRSLSYYDIRGEAELLDAISGYMKDVYACDTTHDDIMPTNGGAEAIYLSFITNIKPGDRVMLITPAYPQYAIVAESLGANIDTFPLTYANKIWSLDLVGLCYEIEEKKPGFIVLNFPHNPTGITLSKSEYWMIADVADTVGATIINDSVYMGYGIDNVYLPGHINIYSMSKAFSLPGLRLGWIAGADKERYVHLKEHVSLAVNTLSASVAPSLLNDHKSIFLNNMNILTANSKVYFNWKESLKGIADNSDLNVPFSLAGFDTDMGDTELSKNLVKHGIFTVPLSLFTGGSGFEGTFLRLGCGDRGVTMYRAKLSAFGDTLAKIIK